MTTESIDSRIEAVLPHLANKADVESLRTEMYRMEARLIKWIVGSMVTMTVIISSIITIFRLLAP